MNEFGRIFRVSLYGESHQESVGVLIDGVKPGIKISEVDFSLELIKRKAGALGTTPRIESDLPIIEGGVFNGYTTGAPILIRFLNNNTKSDDYSQFLDIPRPSHADFTAGVKYNGFNDYRGGGHFSGRLTLGLVSAGVIAKKMLNDINIETTLVNLGGSTNKDEFHSIIEEAVRDGDSIGGICEIKVENVPVGLGEPYFDSLESTISHILFSIGGVKGVEFGSGFSSVNLRGSEFNDSIINKDGKTKTNHNGGINGGISNGNDIIIRVFMKPTPSIAKEQKSYSRTKDEVVDFNISGRHDSAIILRGMACLEAAVAIALCDATLVNKAIYK